MLRAAARAGPRPNRQPITALRTGAGAAGAALLGGELLVNLLEPHAGVIALVLQHGSKRTPARVQDGLRHPGLGQSLGVDVAHEDGLVLAHQAR